jgi:hypothetical protein
MSSWFDKLMNCCKSTSNIDGEKKLEALKSQGTFGDNGAPHKNAKESAEDETQLVRGGQSTGRSQSPISYNDDYSYSQRGGAKKSNKGVAEKKNNNDSDQSPSLFAISNKDTSDVMKEAPTPVMGSRRLEMTEKSPGRLGRSPTQQHENNKNDESQDNIPVMKGSLVFNKLPRAPPSATDNTAKETEDDAERKERQRHMSLRNVMNSTPIMAPRTRQQTLKQ